MKYSVIIISLILAFTACHQAPPPEKPAVKSASQFKIAVVSQANLGASLQLPGVMKPYNSVDIYPKVSGFVKNLYVDRGSIVHKGETLLVLEAPEIDEEYYAAQSKYLQSKALSVTSKDSYDRLLATSSEPGTVSQNDLELAKSKWAIDSSNEAASDANLIAAETEKGYLLITAPFDGVITERNISPGALVGPTTKIDNTKPLLVLEELDKLRLVVNISESDCDLINDKTQVNFTVISLPGQTFTGTVSRSAEALDMKFRSEPVEIDVMNDKGLFMPGMYAEVNIPLVRKSAALVVPSSAIVKSTERHYIIVLKNKITHYINIEEGNSHNDSTEVYGNQLQAGDSVISNANDEIKEGQHIN